MALLGTISPFNIDTDIWTVYQERLEQYLTVNNVRNERKVAALLTLLGDRAYALLRNLTSPAKPSEQTFGELCDILNQHLSPKPLMIAERFRFHKRNQLQSESVNDFIAVLRKMTEHCEFGPTLDDSLRDQFVCGLKDEAIQRKMLSTKDLTLVKAIEIANAMETAIRDAAELRGATNGGHVEKVSIQKQPQAQRKSRKNKKQSDQSVKCEHCGKTNHKSKKCRFRNATCYKCQKKGHISSICTANVNALDDLEVRKVHTANSGRQRIEVTVDINGKKVVMEVDTGSSVSLISNSNFKRLFGKVNLEPPKTVLKTYSGEIIPQIGVKTVTVRHNGQSKSLRLHVVKNNGSTLMGRDWLTEIRLDWERLITVNAVRSRENLSTVLSKYSSVFSEGIGRISGMKGSLTLKEQAKPKFCKARPIPYALKPKVEEELENLEKQGIITKVHTSEWATPVVPIVKPNGKIRICGDFKVTVNQALDIDRYPLPRVEDIFANLSPCQKFTKLDLRQAYLHLEMDEASKKMLTINTHKGLYSMQRLAYGVASAPAIWQRTIEQILQGIKGVQCILDDMIITGSTDEEHLQTLDTVLSRLEKFGLKLNKDKCSFFQDRISYCGHEIDKHGLWKSKDKVDAVLNSPRPHNVSTLRAYLGLLNYYHRFLNNLSTVIKPLNELLEKNKKFDWSQKCEEAFKMSKQLITSEPVLTHYDPGLPVRLATDASPYGVSAILSHVMKNGEEKPIAYASRSLTKTEQRYAQIDKESLAIYWGVKKFYPYLYGRKFTLITDCKPLVSIFSPKKNIPVTTAARVQRYAVFLSGFDYDIEYKNTQRHGNVDGLSRLPLPTQNSESTEDCVDVFYTKQIEQLPVTNDEIRRETQRENVLSRVFENTQNGWKYPLDNPLLKAFYNRRNELTIHRGCLMWGIRVVIPIKLRRQILDLLHASHPGIVKMKSLARSYVWWPGIDNDIENLVNQCTGCQMHQKAPPSSTLHPWEWPTSPWERIHVDFAGPFLNKMFLVVVDAHSKWPEIVVMKSTTAERTVEELRTIFARNGLPKQLVSDNGVQFTSEVFQKFMKNNGILHLRSAPFKPSTNGLAERFVGTFKTSMRAMALTSNDLNLKISIFLMRYRNTAHSLTGETPSKMFLGRNLRTRLDLLRPDTHTHVTNSQMKLALNDQKKLREFDIGQNVLVRDYRGNQKWFQGSVVSREGPLMYTIDVGNGLRWRRHADQIRKSELIEQPLSSFTDKNRTTPFEMSSAKIPENDNSPSLQETDPKSLENKDFEDKSVRSKITNYDKDNGIPITAERRYPARVRKPPDRLSL